MENGTRILVVEDEFMILEDIAMRLEDFGYAISGKAISAEEALAILEKRTTDLALLDINIAGDMDGIGLARIIREKYSIPFIFLTSLANKAIVERAREVHPSAYLLKPFNDRQVQIAIELALQNYSDDRTMERPEPVAREPRAEYPVLPINGSLFLKKDAYFERIAFADILYLEASGNYTFIHTESERFVYSTVIKTFESRLPVNHFLRVHRTFIVNIHKVTGFEGSTLHLGTIQIPVSRTNRDNVLRIMKDY
ncbi:MAG TPA: response regulator [Prolixibacteraceae bacterium]|nr:response regulator [Prolixibacteraceae bacterium]